MDPCQVKSRVENVEKELEELMDQFQCTTKIEACVDHHFSLLKQQFVNIEGILSQIL